VTAHEQPLPGPRATFLSALERALTETSTDGPGFALLLVDADDFGALAARIGPLRADALLGELERRLAEAARPNDTVCRTGGDGLAALLPESGRAEAESLFARLQADLRRRLPADAPVGLSAGIAAAHRDERPAALLARAERALQRAKEAGKGTAMSS
jgi:diguanylate cyclase (GGDEF)-like protein